MQKDRGKKYCTIDHASKQSDAFGFNPYQFWLRQAQRQKHAVSCESAIDRDTDGNKEPPAAQRR